MTRQPVAAGKFYPEDKVLLTRDLDICFKAAKSDVRTIGGIAPHAGYMYSGKCAARLYSTIDPNIDSFIILGFSHMGMGSGLNMSVQDWITPLGKVNFDRNLAETLRDFTTVDEVAHINEHSIEVQLPFIQHLFNAKMVAISVSDNYDRKIPAIMANILKKSNTGIIASSDFTHYGASFGYRPFTENIRENIKKLDNGALQHILKKDSKGFRKYIEDTGDTVCGRAPIEFMIELMKHMGNEPELLDYYTSGDISDDYEHSVSYASIGYKK